MCVGPPDPDELSALEMQKVFVNIIGSIHKPKVFFNCPCSSINLRKAFQSDCFLFLIDLLSLV